MGRFDKKDPKLSEVKAVLQRLQGLPGESEADADSAHTAGPKTWATRGMMGMAGVTTAAIILASVGIFGAAYMVVGVKEPEKPVAPRPADVAPSVAAGAAPRRIDPSKEPEVRAGLETARTLMTKGRVRAARERLLPLAEQGSPDAAWDLARSYDPNVLVALPAADAGPDVEQATRWYRAWYAVAVQEGLVADSISLERIIGSMQRK